MDALAQTSPRSSPFWSTAAAFGALWGSVEITLGSFLHTLKVPFSGAVLAAIGAALLVAERQVAPARGLSLATALIASLCKSLSPGGVILGPMLGISVEGLLVELALLAAPRFAGSAALAGTLAAVWAVFQKVLVGFVLYGGTALELYKAVLKKAGEWLGHSDAGWWIAAVLVVAIATIGAVGGVLGWRVGQDAAKSLEASP
ncbi:MAG: hypothetical protein QM765_13815 [Myxococcales bacterium]